MSTKSGATLTNRNSASAARLATIRRLYFYFIAAVSLIVGMIGFLGLIEVLTGIWLSDQQTTVNTGAFVRNAIARGAAPLVVATPIFAIHWAYIQRMRDDPQEAHAGIRKFALYVISGVALGYAASSLGELITEATKLALGAPLAQSALWPSRWLYLALSFLVSGGLLAYFQNQLATDGDWGKEQGWAGTWRRLFQAIVGISGIALVIGGAGTFLDITLNYLLDFSSNYVGIGWARYVGIGWARSGASEALAMLLVGALLWRANWLRWQKITHVNRVEGRSALRRVFLYGSVVISAGVTLTSAAVMLRNVLLRLLDPTLTSQSLWENLISPLAFLPVGLIAWIWHWRQVQREAASYGDSPESTTIRRLYYYLVAATGLVLLWLGLVDLLRVLVDWLAAGATIGSERFRAQQLANGLGLLAIGAPVWAAHWNTVQTAARQAGKPGLAERTAGPRRAYLYAVALVGALIILFDLASVVYRVFLWLLGEPNADVFGVATADSLVRSGVSLVFWLVHVMAIRRDGQRAQEVDEEEVEEEEEEAEARRAALEERARKLEEELADIRAELQRLAGSGGRSSPEEPVK
jgi:hypothetical protein